MYKIYCNNIEIYNPQKENTALTAANLSLESNTAGSGVITMPCNHPNINLDICSAIFTVYEDEEIIFKGRALSESTDWNKSRIINLEGLLSVFADAIKSPFAFPGHWLGTSEYINQNNDARFFLEKEVIESYNSNVDVNEVFSENYFDYPMIKWTLGECTVSEYEIERSSEDYNDYWTIIKDKLFNSSLGGYICSRYENGHNYIDYLSDFTEENTQEIYYAGNLLDLTTETILSDTASVILATGANNLYINSDNAVTNGSAVFGNRDLFFLGKYICSKSALQKYGWRETRQSWDRVTTSKTLIEKAAYYLVETGAKKSKTINISACDLHLVNSQIEALRINKKVKVVSAPHGINELYDLTKLEIDMIEPQNTKITVTKTESIS